jgi:hypothetical protein
MTGETEEDLITEFLLRYVPLSRDQERKAMEAIGRMLIAKSGVDASGDGNVPQDDFVCYMLGHLLVDGEVSIKPIDRDLFRDRRIAQYITHAARKRGTFAAAVVEAAERFKVSEIAVKRAWAKHKELGKAVRKTWDKWGWEDKGLL